MTERRDKRGRRIGYNWWREYNNLLLAASENWWQACRQSGDPVHTDAIAGAAWETGFYQLSDEEFRQMMPRPTLKELLVKNKGMGRVP